MVNTLIITGSPRPGANSDTIGKFASDILKEEGNNVEIFNVRGKNIHNCIGCSYCKKKGVCKFEDDGWDLIQKIQSADNVLFVTPVYFLSVPGISKIFIDRFYSVFNPEKMFDKPEEEKKLGVVLTFGAVPPEQIKPIIDFISTTFAVVGCSDTKGVLLNNNNDRKAFRTKDNQQEEVKDLLKWLNQ
ncbi:MAG: flavodoxin family protein [Methanobrevibacter sp.]